MKSIRMAMLAVAVTLSGCAATVVKDRSTGAPAMKVPAEASRSLVLNITGTPDVLRSSDWDLFRGEWRGALAAESAAADIPFSMQTGEVRPTGQNGTLLAVTVSDYRYMSTGARIGLGALGGNAYVDAKVRFIDLKTGVLFGEESLRTSSSAWQGVFSAMTLDQLRAIAKDIVSNLKPR